MRRTAIIAIVLVAVLALAGCAAQAPTGAEQKAKCFANEALLQTEMKLFNADTGGMDPPFQSVVDKTKAVCPGGGTYSYDPATGLVTCSVHGHP
jgi:hypothetical protein